MGYLTLSLHAWIVLLVPYVTLRYRLDASHESGVALYGSISDTTQASSTHTLIQDQQRKHQSCLFACCPQTI